MIDDLLRNAQENPGTDLPAPPRLELAIVTCMDARIDPAAILGLQPGDAHVIRNAGGVVTDDVIRSLILSQALLGTKQVMVIQHTRCGVNAAEDDLRAAVTDAVGEPPGPLHGFEDLEESVRAQLAALKAAPQLENAVRGFVYEIDTGRLREVS